LLGRAIVQPNSAECCVEEKRNLLPMSTSEPTNEVTILQQLLEALRPLSREARQRLLQTVATFFEVQLPSDRKAPGTGQPITPTLQFSDHPSMSPKQFLMEKDPRTDIERVACLAFYLTHYRDVPHFKTIDISKLNTEAAQVKFSNAAYAVDNATKAGYLVSATKGNKQLSAIGEQFVQALPDREAAKQLLERRRPRRTPRTNRLATDDSR
jgi:hypothetical protein